MNKFTKLFPNKYAIIGMIHLNALPATPKYNGNMQEIINKACKEVEIYIKHGIDAVLIENMNDVPYVQSKHFQPETVATMTRLCTEIKRLVPKNIPCGVQVLACGNKEALAIAKACDLNFIRVESFVFGHIADEGFMNAVAGELLRYRRLIDAENVLIFTDIKKKHSSHSITADLSLVEVAKAAEFFLSDGVIVTGSSTGMAVDTTELNYLEENIRLPVLVGSGVTLQNFKLYQNAHAFIIGSHFKKHGLWANDVDDSLVKEFMNKINTIRRTTHNTN